MYVFIKYNFIRNNFNVLMNHCLFCLENIHTQALHTYNKTISTNTRGHPFKSHNAINICIGFRPEFKRMHIVHLVISEGVCCCNIFHVKMFRSTEMCIKTNISRTKHYCGKSVFIWEIIF